MDSGLHSRDGSYAFGGLQSITTLQYYCLAAVVILYYDFALTIGQEIRHIWRQRISLVSSIFILNRYLTCFGYIPVIYFLFNTPHNNKACTMFGRFPGSLSTITQLLIAVLLIMRVYALYQGKAWVLWVTVPLGVLTVVVAAWGLTQIQTSNISFGPQTGYRACIPSALKTNIIFKVSWFINGAFDTVVFALTVYKTYRLCKEHRQVGMQSGLASLLERDGGMFYAIMAIANLFNAIFFLQDQEKFSFFEESAGNNSVLTHTLSSTLLSRLILNLREAGSRVDTNATGFSNHFSSATRFRRADFMLDSTSTNHNTIRNSENTGLTTAGSTTMRINVGNEPLTQSQETRV